MPLSGRPGGQRRGSPWTGVGIVVAKETADHLGGIRMVVLEALIFLVALFVAWLSTTAIRETIGQSPFLFLNLLTIAPDPIPVSFAFMIGLVIPVIAIALGFDAINAEFNQRTLSRILAQPIYRDALLVSTLIAGPRETIFGPNLAYFQTEQIVNWLSPNNLYNDITQALLQPKTRALGIGSVIQLVQQRGAIGAPLPVSQSFILIWPQ